MATGDEIIAEVRENIRKLDSCERHEFRPIMPKMFSRQVCAHCGGTVDTAAAMWYKKGIEHAKEKAQ